MGRLYRNYARIHTVEEKTRHPILSFDACHARLHFDFCLLRSLRLPPANVPSWEDLVCLTLSVRVQEFVGDQVVGRLGIEAQVVLVHLLGRAGLREVKRHFLEGPSVFGAVDADGNLVGSVDCLCLTACRKSFLLAAIRGHVDFIQTFFIMTNLKE